MTALQQTQQDVALIVQLLVQAAKAASDHPQQQRQLAQTVLLPILTTNQTTISESTLECLVEAASKVPLLLSTVMEPLTVYCHRANSLPATQVLTTLAAEQPHPILTAALQQHHVPLCLQTLQQELEDEDELLEPASLQDDIINDFGCGEDAAYASELLQDCLHICGKTALEQVLVPVVHQWSSSSPRAALLALQCACVAVSASFQAYRSAALDLAIPMILASNYHAVQYGAVVLLGLLCDENADDRVVQALCQAIHSPCTRVAAAAACAIVSLVRGKNDESVIATRHGPLLVQALIGSGGPFERNALEPGVVAVQTRALGALATIAQAMGGTFVYYGATMQIVKGALQVRELQDAALEAASLIGQVVGVEVFLVDAQVLLQTLVAGSGERLLSLEQLLACARIASAIGEEYEKMGYTQRVLPQLLHLATEAADVEITVRCVR